MKRDKNDAAGTRRPHIVGLAGNWTRPSRTRTLVQAVLHSACRNGMATATLLDLIDAGPALGQTTDRSKADAALAAVLQQIQDADALVIGTAVYKGAYTGLFKHLFDLFEMDALARKPVVLTATGASAAHASVIDYHLRPLFLFFDASVATRGLYGLPQDFDASGAPTDNLLARVDRSVDELAALLAAGSLASPPIAARPKA